MQNKIFIFFCKDVNTFICFKRYEIIIIYMQNQSKAKINVITFILKI